MNAKEALDARITELTATYTQIEAVIDDPYTDPRRRDAAIRYLAGCGTELAKVKVQRANLDRFKDIK